VLGGLRVHARGLHTGAEGLGGAKPRRVFLSLLLHRGVPVAKERLVDLVWDGHPPNGCVATLETYVCLLRKRVQPLLPAGSSLIRTLAGRYAMDMSLVDLDLDRYERLAATGLRPDVPAATALPVLREALALGRHPLLPEEADDGWLADSRRSHVDHVHRTLVDAAAKVAGLPGGDGPRWAEEALQGDRLDESAWLALLLGLERGGRHADGLRAYERCRRLYAAELGCTPGARLQQVHLHLLRGTTGDDELRILLDAVVRLHTVTRPQADHGTTAVPAVSGAGGVEAMEQAADALSRLLRAAARRQSSIRTIVA